MAQIRPFAAYRPAPALTDRIAALPYDVYSRSEAAEVVKDNPLSFLAIDRAETQFDQSVGTFDECVYEKARDMLREAIRGGRFIKENKPCYYLYEMTMDGRSQTGVVACASIDDYISGVIKKHENTRLDKEMDRIRHVDVTNMQTGPIFLCCRSQERLAALIASVKKEAPDCDFMSGDVRQRVWTVRDADRISEITDIFAAAGNLYIADGHHRCASAVRVGLRRREANPGFTGEEEFNYFLSVIFPENELYIMDYNRVVKDLHGLSEEAFLHALEKDFAVSRESAPVHPDRKGVFGLYLKSGWYRMQLRDGLRPADPVGSLDVSVLQDLVLGPILGIGDPKEDPRISFVGGIRGLAELEKKVKTDSAAAFSMYPTSMEELFAVADAGLLMPPKSTWFEPKLLSGLFLHSLD
ncbi:MAG: DUF1015 domain-containing protein [Lachnospiraceae bacterium]|nr:DUF1015 domain-containing protein [Lachnospiraceae bacterium]